MVCHLSDDGGPADVGLLGPQDAQEATCAPDFGLPTVPKVHVRVALKGDSFTTTAQSFVFFPVTSAATTLIFGPGLLHGGLAGEAATFVIRARDANNENRQTGNDDFTVVIHHGDRVLRNVSVRDRDDGSYLVSFSPDAPGKYTIAVVFNGTFGGLAGAVRGSGADVVFESSGARANNTFTGKLLATQIRHDLRLVEDWLESTLAAISAPFHKSDWSDSENRAALVSVKLGLVEVAEGTAANGLILDRLACTLAFLKSQGSNVGPQLALLDKHRSVYEQVLSQAPPAELRIAPYMKDQASRTASDMADHEARCRAFSEKVARAPFQTRDGASLEAMVAEYTVEEGKLEEMMHLAALFDCRDQMCQSVELCADAGRVLGAFSAFWSLAGECREYMRQAGEVHFRDLDAAGLVDNGDFVRHKVMAMPPAVLKSEAQAQLVKTAVHFQSACHLVASLKRAALRERHWAALSASVEQDVRSMALSEILALDLPASFVTQVCDGALREAARESALKSVEAFWAAAVFDTTYYKQTDVPLLALAESDAAQLAHDQLALRTAAHKTTFLKTELEEWQTSLATVAATAAMLTAVQRTWTCLEPLFGAPEVKAELPVASSHFKSAHARLRSVLRSLAHSKNVIRACSQSGVGEQLDSLHADLESLKRALADFVNAKRDTFPRFYFIAEADLLDMLRKAASGPWNKRGQKKRGRVEA
ncbi:dynein heavy chain, N-terminal region 2-domain-containing protein [Pelagophyceae sp. CCMP2097]|nr:dynein heavy chain, N-terminal region 2-domain-containing protein [Pelagophyceae sp. CCMP2097]